MAGFAKNVSGQFAGMRKPQNFTLYPARYDNGTTIQIQSDKCIGRLNPDTGAGIFYKGKGEHPSGVLLAYAEPIQYPAEFVAAVKASHEATYGRHGVDGPIQITGMPASGNSPALSFGNERPNDLSPTL